MWFGVRIKSLKKLMVIFNSGSTNSSKNNEPISLCPEVSGNKKKFTSGQSFSCYCDFQIKVAWTSEMGDPDNLVHLCLWTIRCSTNGLVFLI